MTTLCPKCNKDDEIQKVSSIVLEGTSSGSYSGPSAGVSYDNGKIGSIGGYSTLHGTSQTNLAQILTPPEKPTVFLGYTGFESILRFVFGIIGACALLLFIGSSEGFYAIAVIVVIIVFVITSSTKENRVKKETLLRNEEKIMWDKAMERWFRLYYCKRDDLIFDPSTGNTCHPVEIIDFIYDMK